MDDNKREAVMKGLVIIPAYNEAKNIKGVIEDLEKNVPTLDYVIINDCSSDSTKYICNISKYNVINLPVNLGIGGGVQTGYKYAKEKGYDFAIQFDGDGQHDAKYISILINYIQNHDVDMVIGSRFLEGEGFQSSFSRRLGIRFLSLLIKEVTGQKILDVTSGFRLVNRRVINEFCIYYSKDYPEPESIVTILKQGGKIGEVPVKMKERKEGTSSINIVRSIYYMIKVSLAIIISGYKGRGDKKWEHNLES